MPSARPSALPTSEPSHSPTVSPTDGPSVYPTEIGNFSVDPKIYEIFNLRLQSYNKRAHCGRKSWLWDQLAAETFEFYIYLMDGAVKSEVRVVVAFL